MQVLLALFPTEELDSCCYPETEATQDGLVMRVQNVEVSISAEGLRYAKNFFLGNLKWFSKTVAEFTAQRFSH